MLFSCCAGLLFCAKANELLPWMVSIRTILLPGVSFLHRPVEMSYLAKKMQAKDFKYKVHRKSYTELNEVYFAQSRSV